MERLIQVPYRFSRDLDEGGDTEPARISNASMEAEKLCGYKAYGSLLRFCGCP
jgi:hypothetical protein